MPSKLAFINEGFCRIASFLEKSLCRVFTYPPVPTFINGGFLQAPLRSSPMNAESICYSGGSSFPCTRFSDGLGRNTCFFDRGGWSQYPHNVHLFMRGFFSRDAVVAQ